MGKIRTTYGICSCSAWCWAFSERGPTTSPSSGSATRGGGLAIHGALLGAGGATVYYTWRHNLSLLRWLDICLPTVLVGQALGRWGNFFNQEAYGRPTTLPWGLDIAPEHRIPPYDDLVQYPATTRFHPTFLYESLWNITALGLILWLERRFRERLKPGDSALLYGALYSVGRFFTEGLRTDSLCVGPSSLDGSCAGGLRVAQIVSLATVLICAALLAWRHRSGEQTPAAHSTAESEMRPHL
jgi:phosphatidylglycerol---prolipoprotein diacylglyceryl transferase